MICNIYKIFNVYLFRTRVLNSYENQTKAVLSTTSQMWSRPNRSSVSCEKWGVAICDSEAERNVEGSLVP